MHPVSPTDLDPLAPVPVDRVELVTMSLPLATPFRTAASERTTRQVMLVHVVAGEVEGWAECVAEEEPTYSPEFVASAALVLRDHLAPRMARDAEVLDLHARLQTVRGHQMAKAALELAVLDAQLRVADRSLASWLGAGRAAVGTGAAVGLHDTDEALLAEVDAALAAGAARVRLKIRPGRAAAVTRAVRDHVGPELLLQADANGSFDPDDPAHVAELIALDGDRLACLEQPFAPDELLAHARLAEQLVTPICLDESIGSLADLETAVHLGACEVLCLKPGRVGGWIEARRLHDRCVELGVAVWVGGMLETGIGRAANLALAALDGMTLPPDLDPRGRFDPDLGDPSLPGDDGLVPVPEGAGIGTTPAWASLLGSEMEVILR
jgi:o-succinylbenzoate synthase